MKFKNIISEYCITNPA